MTLVLKNVSKRFGKHQIIDNLSVVFQPGMKYILRGRSGAGKSTILNMIARFDDDYHGIITYDDGNLKTIKKSQYYRDYLGYLFQNYALLEDQTVFDNLALVFRHRIQKQDTQEMRQALEAVDLSKNYLKKHIYELSGGEQQRVAIARLILKKPRIILIDEPTAALDYDTATAILYQVLDRLINDQTIMIVATHDPLVIQWGDVMIDV
ncbi:ATP-binding cassette domain-containing protein [Leuconostoc lactis]|mgnify:FL=1|uniref:ATP-binding cassette domain-containing protein n=1 Tax=Leuconostoc lactis TaxID=1246 RepID=UPI000E8D1E52|nr:ATP-binding cassette domain-containing protein [Leuconostoc lactis]QEA46883.1 ATP-binding cassette domain-containing protein [Leuconostoc lactis]WKY78874.1 ATP-binding cassette domain-containing protein [Leuconostoc lactis]HBP97578.1 peptide ABC transporter ATP-binding protein [Leuconostoc lactis]